MDNKKISDGKSVSVMQPYFFPFIGYFQLLYLSDVFVLYDDVHFIKQGWINRNRILINGKPKYITIPCKDISSHTLIKDIRHALDGRLKNKLRKKVKLAYQSAPFFESVFPLFERVIHADTTTISALASRSIEETCRYLQIKTDIKFSSEKYDNLELDRSDRLIDICRQENAVVYINSSGGKEMYDKDYFDSRGITLKFLEPKIIVYNQFENEFIPGLSILDVMMFNPPGRINEMLKQYRLQ